MTYQKIMIMQTSRSDPRSSADGWTLEDGFLARHHIGNPVGRIRSCWDHAPETPLHALGEGWRLLAPPARFEIENDDKTTNVLWEWWFEKLTTTEEG